MPGYDGSILELPVALAGFTAHKNPTRISARELIDAQGVSYEDGLLQKEAGAAAVDAVGIAGAVTHTATLSVASAYVGEILTYEGGTTPAWVKEIDTEVGGAARTSFNFVVPAAGVAGGDDILLTIGGRDVPAGLTATDSAGNTYVNRGRNAEQTLHSGTENLAASLSASKNWAAVHLSYALRANVPTGDVVPVEVKNGQQSTPATGLSVALGASVNAGSTVFVLLYQRKNTVLATPTVSVGGQTYFEAAAKNTPDGTTRIHVFSLSNVNAYTGATLLTVNWSVATTWLYDVVAIDTAYITAAPLAAGSSNSGVGTSISSVFPGVTPPLQELGFLGVGAKQSDATITTGTGWATLNSVDGTSFNVQTRIVRRRRAALTVQHLEATAVNALTVGQTITVTAPEACFMYGAATQFTDLDDGFDRQADNSVGVTGTTAVSIGPTSPLSSAPEIALAGVCVNATTAAVTYTDTSSPAFTLRSSVTDTTSGTQVRVLTRAITTTPTIVGLFDWHPVDGTQRIITVAMDGKIYKEVGGDLDSVTLASGWSTTGEHRPRFVPAGWKGGGSNARELFIFNGQDEPDYLSADGATTSAPTPPADWTGTSASALADQKQPLNGIFHQNRVWAFGNKNFPHHVYASAPGDHSSWTGTDSFDISIESSIGERLYCAAVYQGILVFWKYPRGIFWLDDTDPDYTLWKIRPKSHGLGCAPSTYAVLPLDDDVMFLSADASFHLLSAVDTLGGTRTSSLSERLHIDTWLRENLNLARLSQAVSVWYSNKGLAVWGVPSKNSQTNDLMLYFDFSDIENGLPPKFAYSYRDTPGALALYRDTDTIERPIMGEAGMVYKLDQAAKTKSSAGYELISQTPHTDFGEVDPSLKAVRKQFDWLEYEFHDDASGALTVEVYVDKVLVNTLSYDATQARQRQRIGAQGYRISLREYDGSSALDQDPRIITRYIGLKKIDDDPRT